MVLLKIEVYPPPVEHPGAIARMPLASIVHYASLLTAVGGGGETTNDDVGRLWSLGRKQGSARVPTDKSVSREHAVLFVCRTEAAAAAAASNESDLPPPCQCHTPDQVHACEEARDDTCVLLRNIGKLGSYLVLPPWESSMAASEKNNASGDDSDTADEEEIVESQQQASQAKSLSSVVAEVTVSEVSKRLVGEKARLQPIMTNETIVLDQLTLLQSEGSSPSTTVVQCGKLGTTIVLTRMTCRFVASGSPAKQQLKSLQYRLDAMGCTVEEFLEPNSSIKSNRQQLQNTYLVTGQYGGNPKQLTAWSQGVPIVSPSFVEELTTKRSSPSDPLPSIEEHQPDSDNNTFWNETANRALWSECTVLSFHPSGHEFELLIRSAGAKVKNVYDDDGNFFSDEAIGEIVAAAPPNSLICISDCKRKAGKLLKKLGVPSFSGKAIAKAIILQRLLQDPTSGEAIGEHSPEEIANFTNKDHDNVSDVDSQCTPLKRSTTRGKIATEIEEPELDIAGSSKSASQSTNRSGRRGDKPSRVEPVAKRGKQVNPNEDETRNGKVPLSKDEVTLPNQSGLPANKGGSQSSDSECSRGDTESRLKGSNRSEKKRAADTAKLASVSEEIELVDHDDTDISPETTALKKDKVPEEHNSKENESSASRSTSLLATSPLLKRIGTANANGWMSALPQGKKRKEYVRSKAEIQEATGNDEVRSAAPTDLVKGLVVCNTARQSEGLETRRTYSGPNFKRFRKNSVPPIQRASIKMHLVKPRESEYRQDLEDQQEGIEAQQRLADELFREDGGGSRSHGRRRL